MKVHWAIDEPPLDLNPATSSDFNSLFILSACIEPLLDLDVRGKVVPALAAGLSSNNQCTSWTLKLRTNTLWSDGTPITSHDVIAGWHHLVDLGTKSPYSVWLSNLVGWEEAAAGETQALGVQAPDEHTVTLQCEEPASYVPKLLSVPALSPLSRQMPDRAGQRWSGPWALEKTTNSIIDLAPNRYWRNQVPNFGISFVLVTDADRAVKEFDSGSLHGTAPLHTSIKSLFRSDLVHSDSPLIMRLRVNETDPSLRAHELCSWLRNAIDRPSLCAGIEKVLAPCALDCSPQLLGSPEHKFTNKHGTRPPLAKQTVELLYAEYHPNGEVAKRLARQLERLTGLHIVITGVSFPIFLERLKTKTFDLAIDLAMPLFPDPFAAYASSLASLPARERNRLLGWFRRAQSLMDRERAKLLFEKVQPVLDRWASTVPLAHLRYCWLARYPLTNKPFSGNQFPKLWKLAS